MKVTDIRKDSANLPSEALRIGKTYLLVSGGRAGNVGKVFIAASSGHCGGETSPDLEMVCLEDGYLYNGYLKGCTWFPVDAEVYINE